MLNHFNFMRKGNEILLTNDIGEYEFLSQENFRKLVTGKLSTDSDCYQSLKDRGFVTDEPLEVFASKYVAQVRSMKDYLFTATSLHIFAVTNQCNLSCVYCQAKDVHSKLGGKMTMETGRKAIELAMQSPAKHLTFEFQGGEPLLNFDVIIEMIEHSKRLNESLKKNIEYTIVTNLVALTDEILQKLIDHHVSICTSLDGDKSVHDHNRKLHNGEGSYEAVYKNITKIRNAGLSVGAIETTTQYSLQYPKEIIDTYISNQVNGIFLRPMTPLGFAKAYWDEIGYTPEQFLCFYREAFLYILEINKHGIHFPELHATYFLKKILGGYADNYMELRSPCGAGVGQMSYYWDGSVYTCDEGRMISESGDFAFRLGNVYENTYDELIDSPICKATCAASVVESLPKCCDCAYHPYCGVCPVVVYSDEHDIFPHSPFDYRCAVYAGILDLLFELIHEADEATMQVLYRWIED